MIEEVRLYRFEIPLTTPYKLSLGDVHHFDTIIAEIVLGSRVGYGEATILTGYTDEEIGASWTLAQSIASTLPGQLVEAAKASLVVYFDKAPFTATALNTAIEMAEGDPLLAIAQDTEVPLLAPVNATKDDAILVEIEALLASGFKTLKVKVGFDPDADARRVDFIRKNVKGRAILRVDANQGFTPEAACRFATKVGPENIELFEQPCADDDWDGAVKVARNSPLPMMLDESIYDVADIDRAASLKAARFIKLKLMKLGGLGRLDAALARIRELGMVPVLGNGVASEIGCWMEGCVARRRIDNAGEMNGFLKQKGPLVTPPLTMNGGRMRLQAGMAPRLDAQAVERWSIARAHFTRSRAYA